MGIVICHGRVIPKNHLAYNCNHIQLNFFRAITDHWEEVSTSVGALTLWHYGHLMHEH